jgi:hypothetical protein
VVGLGTTIPAGSSIIEPIFASVANTAKMTAQSPWSVREKVRTGAYSAKKDGKRLLIILDSVRKHAANLPDAVLGRGPPVKAAIEGQRRRRAKQAVRPMAP